MIGHTVIRYGHVTSTMSVASHLLEGGARHGTVVVADHQTAGLGRAGRSWHDEIGDALLMTVILRLDTDLSALSPLALLTAGAVCAAVEQVTSLRPQIKWPNDVVLDGRKLAGILILTSPTDGEIGVLLGIGLNLRNRDHDPHRAALDEDGTHLVTRDHLIHDICHHLDAMVAGMTGDGVSRLWSRARAKLWLVGDRVSVVDHDREHTGICVGVDDDGALLLQTASGERRIVAGDVTRGPRPKRP